MDLLFQLRLFHLDFIYSLDTIYSNFFRILYRYIIKLETRVLMVIPNILFQLQPKDFLQIFIIILAFVFIFFSGIGWVMEVFFRRYVSAKKWMNPGFLKGPWLPIYGAGVIILSLYVLCLTFFSWKFPSKVLFHVTVIIGSGILMTLLELIAGHIFICKMHIRLWDYSDCSFNYKGIICPQFSIYWTILGAIFYFFLFPPITRLIVRFISSDWFLFAIFFMGIAYGIFIIDLMQSMEAAKKLKLLADENHLILRLENFKQHIRQELMQKNIKPVFFSPFKSPELFHEHIKTFLLNQENIFEKFFSNDNSPTKRKDKHS